MAGFSSEYFDSTLCTTRSTTKKRNHQAMHDDETRDEKGNTERKEEAKEHSKKRRLESMEGCSSHKKRKETEGFEEVKDRTNKRKVDEGKEDKKHGKQRERKDGKDTKRKRNTEYRERPIVCVKKRKTEDIEEYERQSKKRKTEDMEDHERQAKKRKTEDMEDHERQAKKRKTEDSKEQERKAKKRRTKDSTQHERQAKKRKTEDSKEHERQAKKRRTKNSTQQGCQVKKWTGEGVEDMLWLEVKAERVSGEKRDVSEYCRIDIEMGNLVEGTVRGHPCTVCLDSGAAASVMMMSLAERMGLVTGGEKKERRGFKTYFGNVSLDVITLAEVVITLRGGVEVNTPVKVFPKDMEDRYPVDILILSMNRLHEAEILQEFHPDGSGSLFLRHPERLRRRPPWGLGKVYTFGLRTLDSDEPLTVLVDTGSSVILRVSKTGQENVTRLTGKCMEPPPQVFLHFGHGTGAVLDVVSKPLRKTDDFTCGRGLFYPLSAVMDYIDSSITFRLGREHYKFAFYPRYTGLRAAHLFREPLPSTHAA